MLASTLTHRRYLQCLKKKIVEPVYKEPVPDVPLTQLAITLDTLEGNDYFELIGGFHDSITLDEITDQDISDANFIINEEEYTANVSYDSVSKQLTFSHTLESAYTGTAPATGIISFMYDGTGYMFTVALEDVRE